MQVGADATKLTTIATKAKTATEVAGVTRRANDFRGKLECAKAKLPLPTTPQRLSAAAAAQPRVKTHVEKLPRQATQLPQEQKSMSAAANAMPLELWRWGSERDLGVQIGWQTSTRKPWCLLLCGSTTPAAISELKAATSFVQQRWRYWGDTS